MSFVDVHKHHVSKGDISFNESVCIRMICSGILLIAMEETDELFYNGRRERTTTIAEPDVRNTMRKYDILQQEIGNFICRAGDQSLCFCEPCKSGGLWQ